MPDCSISWARCCSARASGKAAWANGFTPLIRAVQAGQSGAVKLLIAKGASVNARDGQGYTALMWTAHAGSTASAQALLAAKADASVVGKDGLTARDIAQKRGRADVAALLPSAP